MEVFKAEITHRCQAELRLSLQVSGILFQIFGVMCFFIHIFIQQRVIEHPFYTKESIIIENAKFVTTLSGFHLSFTNFSCVTFIKLYSLPVALLPCIYME